MDPATQEKSQSFSFRKRAASFRYAFHGVRILVKTQHNIWIHLLISVIVITAGFWLKISASDWIALVFATGFVLAAEAFNTAIEFLTDLVSPHFDQKAGLVKDVAAAGVLIAALTAVIIGILVFWKYL